MKRQLGEVESERDELEGKLERAEKEFEVMEERHRYTVDTLTAEKEAAYKASSADAGSAHVCPTALPTNRIAVWETRVVI